MNEDFDSISFDTETKEDAKEVEGTFKDFPTQQSEPVEEETFGDLKDTMTIHDRENNQSYVIKGNNQSYVIKGNEEAPASEEEMMIKAAIAGLKENGEGDPYPLGEIILSNVYSAYFNPKVNTVKGEQSTLNINISGITEDGKPVEYTKTVWLQTEGLDLQGFISQTKKVMQFIKFGIFNKLFEKDIDENKIIERIYNSFITKEGYNIEELQGSKTYLKVTKNDKGYFNEEFFSEKEFEKLMNEPETPDFD